MVRHRLAGLLLGLLSLGHAVTGAVTVWAALGALGGGGFGGVVAGFVYAFSGVVLLFAAAWGLRLAAGVVRGDPGQLEAARFLLIGFAVLNIFSPLGAGPVLPLVSPADSGPLRLGIVAIAVVGVALLGRIPREEAPNPGPASNA